jgi:hypothetical protein
MGPRHLGFVETASKGNIDLLLDGDSITDWWVQGDANKAMFDKYFGSIRTANFAIAGDTTQGVLCAPESRRCRRCRTRDAEGLSRCEDSNVGDLPA